MHFSTFLALLVIAATAAASQKRGLIYIPSRENPDDDDIWILTWYYNYGFRPSRALRNADWEFVPMLWGEPDDRDSTEFLDTVREQLDANAAITHVLGFNEPDGERSTGGSDMTPERAAEVWLQQIEPLKEQGIRLGSPAVTGSPRGLDWLARFFNDFEAFASYIGQTQVTYPNASEIWVTEFGWAFEDLSTTQQFFNSSLQHLDEIENITRYSYFGSFRSDVSNVGPNASMLTQDGELTDIGSLYLGQRPTGNIPLASAGSEPSAASRLSRPFALATVSMLIGICIAIMR